MQTESNILSSFQDVLSQSEKSKSDNEISLKKLIQIYRSANRRLSPFVGAGLSINFYPGWTSFLRNSANSKPETKANIDRLLGENQYELAASYLEQYLGANYFHELITQTFGKEIQASITGGISLLPIISSGPIFTTNFDRLIETVFNRANQPFGAHDVFAGDRIGLIHEAINFNSRKLIKLHGDWEDRESRILTKEEYDAAYGELIGGTYSKNVPRRLNLLFGSCHLLFLGCSLQQDRTMDMLNNAVQTGNSMFHFALLSEPESERHEERRKFLFDRNIYPIWYKPDKTHSAVEDFLNVLTELYSSGHGIASVSVKLRNTALIEKDLAAAIPGGPSLTEENTALTHLLNGKNVLLLGPAGTGKSYISCRITEKLLENNATVLFLQGRDIQAITIKEVKEFIEENIHNGIAKEFETHTGNPRYLIIDSLDVLALSSPVLKAVLAYFDRIRTLPGISFLLSCREFDYRYNADLQPYSRIAEVVQVSDFPLKEVERVLEENSITIPSDAEVRKQVLFFFARPIRLRILFDCREAQEPIENLAAENKLYLDLWNHHTARIQGKSQKSSRENTAFAVVRIGMEHEKLKIPIALMSGHDQFNEDGDNDLVSSGFFEESKFNRSFFHQTVFDHVASFWLLSSGIRPISFLESYSGKLFTQPVFLAYLGHFRETNFDEYLEDIRHLLQELPTSPIWRMLVARHLAEMPNPKPEEVEIVFQWLQNLGNHDYRLLGFFFRNANSGWLSILHKNGFFSNIAEQDKERTILNSISLLSKNVEKYPDLVAEIILLFGVASRALSTDIFRIANSLPDRHLVLIFPVLSRILQEEQ